MTKEEKRERQRALMKKQYDLFKTVQEIIDKDVSGKGAKYLEADGDNTYVGKLFHHPNLYF